MSKTHVALAALTTFGLGVAGWLLLPSPPRNAPLPASEVASLDRVASDSANQPREAEPGNPLAESSGTDDHRPDQTPASERGRAGGITEGSQLRTSAEPFEWYPAIEFEDYPALSVPIPSNERPCASYVSMLTDYSLADMIQHSDAWQSAIPECASLFVIQLEPVGYDANASTPVVEIIDIGTGEAWTASGQPTFTDQSGSQRHLRNYILAPHRPDAVLLVRGALGTGAGTVLVRPNFFQHHSRCPTGGVSRMPTLAKKNRSVYGLKVLCFDADKSSTAGEVEVRNADGNPVSQAMVVKDGQILGWTDRSGIGSVYSLPDTWDAYADGYFRSASRYAIWCIGYTPRFISPEFFDSNKTASVALTTHEVYLSGTLNGKLPNSRLQMFERNARLRLGSGFFQVNCFSYAVPGWSYEGFAKLFSEGPLSAGYLGPLKVVPNGTPEDVRDSIEATNRELLETRIKPLAEASGQENPNWDEFQEWYGRLWRLDGSSLSIVLPFDGRFLVSIGREDATVVSPNRPSKYFTDVLEVMSGQDDSPRCVLHSARN